MTVVPIFGVEVVGPDGIAPDQVLEEAKGACEQVVVLGYEKGTQHVYVAASFPAGYEMPRTLWLIEQAKRWLISGCPSQDDE